MKTYPVNLVLDGRLVVAIGAGQEMARKVLGLLEVGAKVRVIAPCVIDSLDKLDNPNLEICQREYQQGDLEGATLAISGVASPSVHAKLSKEALESNVLLNVIDEPRLSTFYNTSVIRSGDLTISIGTGGKAPALSKRLRLEMENRFSQDYADFVFALGELREDLNLTLAPEKRAGFWTRAVSDISFQSFKDNPEEWRRIYQEVQPDKIEQGTVYLVGAGPGDPGLITARGLDLLRRADGVLHDALISPELLKEIPAKAEIKHVGKRAGSHAEKQESINQLLLDFAQRHSIVVRLKGGDPFIFGRGGEEVRFLQEAGINVEVVPGVSSVLAGPASIGVPITDRDCARSFAVVTGHQLDKAEAAYWQSLANLDTLIVVMGMANIDAICKGLIKAGKTSSTPAAVISRATTPEECTVRSSLEHLAKDVENAKLETPALLVVGEVLNLSK